MWFDSIFIEFFFFTHYYNNIGVILQIHISNLVLQYLTDKIFQWGQEEAFQFLKNVLTSRMF